jgi:DNA-binding NarL/FixJ family response regulator
MAMISIALIEDNRLVREGISSLLNRLPDVRVVADGSGDVSRLSDIEPQVILLDVDRPDGDGLRIAARARTILPRAKVIAMDLPAVQDDLVDWVRAGVSGFIMKDATFDDLVRTIRAVTNGAKILPPQMTGALFSQITRDHVGRGVAEVPYCSSMTRREQEVISLIAEGLSNKGIASRLHIATHTVKSHVRNIMEKLSLRTRLQIAAYSHRQQNTPSAGERPSVTATVARETPRLRSLPIASHHGAYARSETESRLRSSRRPRQRVGAARLPQATTILEFTSDACTTTK